jgi:outer membrane protein W
MDPHGSGGLKLDRSSGAGLAVTDYFSDAVSLEVAASRTKSDLSASGLSLGSLQITPLTAALQYHVSNFYVGGGGGYAMFGSVRNGTDFDLLGYSSIHFKNRFGWLVDAGANIPIRGNWGVNVDAKYMRFNVSSSATLTDGTRTNTARTRLSPIALGAGVTFRF